jgi:hypothetical protein
MRQSEINTPARLWDTPQPGTANLCIERGLQQSLPTTDFTTGPKSQPFDDKLPHGTLYRTDL